MHTDRANSPVQAESPRKGHIMQSSIHVSIIISDLEAHDSLTRLLLSLSHQSTWRDSMEIIVTGNGNHSPSDVSLWRSITDINDIYLDESPSSASTSTVRNAAAAKAKGAKLLFLRPEFRLDPKFMTTARSVFEEHPETGVMYSDYISLAPPKDKGTPPGLVQLPDFREELLQTNGFLGPGVIFTREAWESTQGFREHTLYRDWDLWIQAAMAGNVFHHVNYPLASCEHRKVSFRERAEDGRGKSMLVINNQGFFPAHTVRWALSYLRGNEWAEQYNFMTIPGPLDVSRMMHDHATKSMGVDAMTQKAIRQFDLTATKSKALL